MASIIFTDSLYGQAEAQLWQDAIAFVIQWKKVCCKCYQIRPVEYKNHCTNDIKLYKYFEIMSIYKGHFNEFERYLTITGGTKTFPEQKIFYIRK